MKNSQHDDTFWLAKEMDSKRETAENGAMDFSTDFWKLIRVFTDPSEDLVHLLSEVQTKTRGLRVVPRHRFIKLHPSDGTKRNEAAH
jgi:hypothetical protein